MAQKITILGEDGLPSVPGVQIKVEDTVTGAFIIYDKGDLRRAFEGDFLTLKRKEDGAIIFSRLKYDQILNGNNSGQPFGSIAALQNIVLVNFFRKATVVGGGGGGTGTLTDIGSANDDIVVTGTGATRTLTLKPIPTAVAAALILKAATSYVDSQDQALLAQILGNAPDNLNTLGELATQVNILLNAVTNSTPDGDNLVNTIQEVLAVFASYPEGADIAQLLSTKFGAADVVNDVNQVAAGKIADARIIKYLNDLIVALQGVVSAKAESSALNNYAYLTGGKVDPSFLTGTVLSDSRLPGAGTDADPVTVNDQMLAAYQFLGSKLIGMSVGISFLQTFGTGGGMTSGFTYGTLVEVPKAGITAVSITYMLGVLGVYTPNNENSLAIFTYDPASGVLTRVAKTADTPTLYSASSATTAATDVALASSYVITAKYVFVVALFNASTTGTPPALANAAFGSQSEKAGIKTLNGGKTQFRSATGGITSMPNTINMSATVTTNFMVAIGISKA